MSPVDLGRWAGPTPEEVLDSLGTGPRGLGHAEAAARLLRHGPNALPAAARRPWYVELVRNFVHLFALLLWVGAALAWVAGMPELGWAIVAVILVNGSFSYWQEYEAERATEALQALLPHRVTVRRDGEERVIDAAAVVPGDVLVLVEGEAVPADARVIVSELLRLDLSALTGESRPVPRTVGLAEIDGRTRSVLPNLVFAGTAVSSGRGEAVVFATGSATEFARIAALTQRQRERPSPLERELGRVTRFVTVLALALGTLCFTLGTLFGGLSPVAGFLFAVGIIVANVPEGLLPTLSLALALAVRRMAARSALVKRLSAVEALGAATVILTDKTGTLTENEMTVREVWAGGIRARLGGVGYEPRGSVEVNAENGDKPHFGRAVLEEVLRAAALCCDAHLLHDNPQGRWRPVGDPTEAAILVAAAKLDLTAERLAAWPRLAELPFDSVRRRMTTVQRIDGRDVACVKGAPSEIFPRCTAMRRGADAVRFDERERAAAQAAHDELAGRGMRVLAVAVRDFDSHEGLRVEEVERSLTLLGLLAMEDPPRPEVPEAVALCRQAGLRVLMVTGDNGTTAAAIGREIGLYADRPRVLNGAEVDGLDDVELSRALDGGDVIFARAAPEQKLRLVEWLQRRGEVVAVTGDGVNDAPALKRADIGVAMGATGTDVAREAADMVLADDNFASIVDAIREGRTVYDNVRKFVTYIFASNIPEIVPFVAFVLFDIPLPLTVMQILAVDLGTDLLPALALGTESPEPDVMLRPPRPRSARLLDAPTLLRAYGWLGLIEGALCLVGFFFAYWLAGWRPGAPLADAGEIYATATTMSLAGIVACQIGNAFACRSTYRSVWQLGFTTNRLLLLAIGVEIALLLLIIYVPQVAAVFGLAPLGPAHWALLLTFAPLLLLLEETRKALRARTKARTKE